MGKEGKDVDYLISICTEPGQPESERQEALKGIFDVLGGGESSRLTVLDLVAKLEAQLTDPSSDGARRQRAVALLGQSLQEVPSLKLNAKHVEVLANFLRGKLRDWHCVEGAARGLLALLRHHGKVLRSVQVVVEQKGGSRGPEAAIFAEAGGAAGDGLPSGKDKDEDDDGFLLLKQQEGGEVRKSNSSC